MPPKGKIIKKQTSDRVENAGNQLTVNDERPNGDKRSEAVVNELLAWADQYVAGGCQTPDQIEENAR